MIIRENKIIDQFPTLKHQKNLAAILKTIFIDMFAPKWARGPHNLARFPSWDPCITPGY